MKFAIFVLSAAAIVAALPGHGGGGTTKNTWNKTEKKCNVGKLQCCNSVQAAKSTDKQTQGLIGAALGSVQGIVGLKCNPITVIGVGGVNCAAQTACCSGNTFGGVVTAGCNAVNANA